LQVLEFSIPGVRDHIDEEVRSVFNHCYLLELLVLIGHHQRRDDEKKGHEERGKKGHNEERLFPYPGKIFPAYDNSCLVHGSVFYSFLVLGFHHSYEYLIHRQEGRVEREYLPGSGHLPEDGVIIDRL